MTDVQSDAGPPNELPPNEPPPVETSPNGASGVEATVQPAPPAFVVMGVDTVALDLPSAFPTVTLVEAEPPGRTLIFPVGLPEGTALALALHKMASPRPLTHELFAEVLQRVHVDIIAVRLIGRERGNYLAELDLMAPNGRQRMACRPSDALVLSLRMPVAAPVLVDERLLAQADDVVPQEP